MTKARKETLTQAELKRLLDYDPATGALTWKPRTPDQFQATENRTAEHACKIWNTRYADKPAFTAKQNNGYYSGQIHGRFYLAHRVIVAWMTDAWPPAETDHVNGVKDDNRWANITIATRSETTRNKKMSSNNTSGITGIGWSIVDQKYRAYIHDNTGKRISKSFSTKAEAIAQRQAWEKKFGYSYRHGTKE